jgi:hypothetical protein
MRLIQNLIDDPGEKDVVSRSLSSKVLPYDLGALPKSVKTRKRSSISLDRFVLIAYRRREEVLNDQLT